MFPIIPGYYGNVSLYLFCKTITQRASRYIKPCPAAGWQDINKMFWPNTLWKNVFFLGTKFSRHPEGLSFKGLRFSGKYRFSFRKVQIFISQSTDFISFRFVSQSTISQSTISQYFSPIIILESLRKLAPSRNARRANLDRLPVDKMFWSDSGHTRYGKMFSFLGLSFRDTQGV